MYRLGKKKADRGRPIRIVMKSEEEKWKLIACAPKVRKVTTENYDTTKIFKVPDLTKFEMEKEQQVRKNLKDTRDRFPNRKFKIKKGKVIQVEAEEQPPGGLNP